jgi:ubiquinone/menaquinone biosynthesis C-methylase UbiE
MRDKIEILPVSLLESENTTIVELKELANELKLEFGWHYLLDLSWIIRYLGEINGQKMIDAGAGTGVMQWYLANNGARVISIDRESRANLPPRFRRRFSVEGFRESDLLIKPSFSDGADQGSLKKWMADFVDMLKYQSSPLTDNDGQHESGMVIIYNQDLESLENIPDNSIDAIVAISSLEHNSPDGLERVVAELLRVLKPGCALLATLGAAKDQDWFHEPSHGWCYSEGTLRKIFNISQEIPSNYDQYDRLFDDLRSNNELKDQLASFYFRSGDNGMPWGDWDPKYQPVGIRKVKAEN